MNVYVVIIDVMTDPESGHGERLDEPLVSVFKTEAMADDFIATLAHSKWLDPDDLPEPIEVPLVTNDREGDQYASWVIEGGGESPW